jgi:hypothetical protein
VTDGGVITAADIRARRRRLLERLARLQMDMQTGDAEARAEHEEVLAQIRALDGAPAAALPRSRMTHPQKAARGVMRRREKLLTKIRVLIKAQEAEPCAKTARVLLAAVDQLQALEGGGA